MLRSVSLKYLVQVAHLCYLCCLFISKCCSSSGENAFERQIVRWYWFLFYFAFCGSGSRKPQIQSFPLPALHREIKPLPLWVVWTSSSGFSVLLPQAADSLLCASSEFFFYFPFRLSLISYYSLQERNVLW